MRDERDEARLLQTFLAVCLQLTGDLDIHAVLTTIVETSMEHTGANYGAAVTLSSSGGIDQFIHRGLTEEQVAALPHLPEGKGLLGLVLTDKTPLRVDKISDQSASVGFPDRHVPMDAFLGIPLIHRDDLVGALYLTKSPGHPSFTEEDEVLLISLGAVTSVGIVNARLFQAESDRAERGVLLRGISAKVRHSLDIAEVLTATVESLGKASAADRCYIRLVAVPGEPDLAPIEHEWDGPGMASLMEDPGQQFPVSSLAANTAMTQWSNDVLGDENLLDPIYPGTPEDLLKQGARAALSTPLVWGDTLLGVVALHSREPRKWDRSDIALLEAASREVSVAIHHALMYSDAIDTAQKLEQLDRLRSDFVSMVSHELRSPMTVIQGISEILQRRDKLLTHEQRAELIDTLGREARRLSRLVSEILDLEAMEGGNVVLATESVDLADLARESAADAGEIHRIDMVLEAGNVFVDVDRDRIKQVLLNLISNAAKFSAPTDRIAITVKPEKDAVAIMVADNGPGIPEDERDQLFRRFSRLPSTSGSKSGSGLGLYLSRMIVEQHRGEIWADSVAGAGATFVFRLPRGVA